MFVIEKMFTNEITIEEIAKCSLVNADNIASNVKQFTHLNSMETLM